MTDSTSLQRSQAGVTIALAGVVMARARCSRQQGGKPWRLKPKPALFIGFVMQRYFLSVYLVLLRVPRSRLSFFFQLIVLKYH